MRIAHLQLSRNYGAEFFATVYTVKSPMLACSLKPTCFRVPLWQSLSAARTLQVNSQSSINTQEQPSRSTHRVKPFRQLDRRSPGVRQERNRKLHLRKLAVRSVELDSLRFQ